jgi:hypothetical protein
LQQSQPFLSGTGVGLITAVRGDAAWRMGHGNDKWQSSIGL